MPSAVTHPFLSPDPGDSPAGVPYPTPAGATVTPGIVDIPVPPGATQVDSYVADQGIVQVFDTHDSEEVVLGFYHDMLYAAGWKQRSAGEGPAGFDCEFAPADELTVYSNGNQPHDWIEVSTAFIPRKGEYTLGTPLAGFRGKGVPFAPVAPGVTRYWLMTPDY